MARIGDGFLGRLPPTGLRGAHEAVEGAWGDRGNGGIVERLSISDAACRVMGWGASRGEMRRIPGKEPAYRLKKRI